MENKVNHRQTLGRQGENIACSYLEGMGHTILERNWRSGHLEIDIISVDPEGIHFVEVKARQKSIQAPPQNRGGLQRPHSDTSIPQKGFRAGIWSVCLMWWQ